MPKLRIAGIQFNPVLGQVEQNVAKIRSLAATLTKPIDLLVLPELAVTGYNFKNAAEIQPFLEGRTGPTYSLARDLSTLYNCTTIVGYPENYEGTTYNLAMVVNEEGDLVHNYRKTHLYETDEAWGCVENPEKDFAAVDLVLGKGSERQTIRTSIGICMDLNPYKFTAPFNEFEFSMSAYANLARLVVVPTAWLDSESPDIQEDRSDKEKLELAAKIKKQLETETYPDAKDLLILLIDYWIVRLFPFLSHPMNGLPKQPQKTTAVICNRTGIEDQTFYGGSLCILQFDRSIPETLDTDSNNPSVSVINSAGRATEEVIYLEVDV